MFNLYEILQNAQNGEALNNLARQFNITPEQTEAVVKALTPSISSAFLNQAGDPAAFGSMLGAMGDPQHVAAFADASAAQASATAQKGSELLQQWFGAGETNAATAHAAQLAGLPPALIQQMLPVIASMVVGGLSKAMANQGWGGVLGQLATAAGQGGLGNILGGFFGGAGQGQPGAQTQAPSGNPTAPGAGLGGLAGVFGSILGSFLGSGATPQQGAGQAPHPGAAPQAPPQTPAQGFDMNSIQAGLEALTKMMQGGAAPQAPGQAPPPRQAAGLQDDVGAEINAIFDDKKRS